MPNTQESNHQLDVEDEPKDPDYNNEDANLKDANNGNKLWREDVEVVVQKTAKTPN